jgi:hypothetical protein
MVAYTNGFAARCEDAALPFRTLVPNDHGFAAGCDQSVATLVKEVCAEQRSSRFLEESPACPLCNLRNLRNLRMMTLAMARLSCLSSIDSRKRVGS